MTRSEKKLLDTLRQFIPYVLRNCGELLGDDIKWHLQQVAALFENPAAALEELDADPIEHWATGRKDPPGTFQTFRPTMVLWPNWLGWCRRTGAQPGTFPGFVARLAKKPWLRRGRTRWGKGRSRKPANGWWGIKT